MEEDLTQDQVFERIIRRLVASRRRIAQLAVPSPALAHNLPGQVKSRRGDFPQPSGLPKVRGLTQWEKQQKVTRGRIVKPPSPFPPNQLISFRDPQEAGEYAEVSTRARVVLSSSGSQPGVSLPAAGQLSLQADRDTDRSVQQQLIPQRYQDIIRQLYQPVQHL
jgi:hypothetical protein